MAGRSPDTVRLGTTKIGTLLRLFSQK
eukprot:SAG11_NODE_19559_length_464_cov_0.690411_1_plen_26_part_01